jgi:hypothetical protein
MRQPLALARDSEEGDTTMTKWFNLVAIASATWLVGCSSAGLTAHHTNPADNSFWFTEVRSEVGKLDSATLWYCYLQGARRQPVCKPAEFEACQGECKMVSSSISADLSDAARFEAPVTMSAVQPGVETAAPDASPAASPVAPKSPDQSAADKSKVGF